METAINAEVAEGAEVSPGKVFLRALRVLCVLLLLLFLAQNDAVARFERQCKCKVVRDYYSDNEEMLAKLAAGATGYDLIVPGGDAVEALIRSQQLRPLDRSKLPNLKNLNPIYLDQPFDPGNRSSVPYAYTVTLIGYNTEKIRELGLPTDTWAVIFIGYSTPKEGAVLALDSMVLNKSGPRPDLAHQFIDFTLEGKSSAELTNLIGSGNPNGAALPYVMPKISANKAVFSDSEEFKRLEMFRALDCHQRRVLSRFWTEIKIR